MNLVRFTLSLKTVSRGLFLTVLSLVLVACGGSNNSDLTQYIAEVKRTPPQKSIDPLPSFPPNPLFVYSAATERSPFQPLVRDIEVIVEAIGENVQPDKNRVQEFLESFPLGSLAMVGSLESEGAFWALIDDGQGGIHRVKKGNYMGRDHGQIIAATPSQLTLVEIVSVGPNKWIKRPATLELSVQE